MWRRCWGCALILQPDTLKTDNTWGGQKGMMSLAVTKSDVTQLIWSMHQILDVHQCCIDSGEAPSTLPPLSIGKAACGICWATQIPRYCLWQQIDLWAAGGGTKHRTVASFNWKIPAKQTWQTFFQTHCRTLDFPGPSSNKTTDYSNPAGSSDVGALVVVRLQGV